MNFDILYNITGSQASMISKMCCLLSLEVNDKILKSTKRFPLKGMGQVGRPVPSKRTQNYIAPTNTKNYSV